MSAGRILVTPRSVTRDGHPALARFVAAGFEVELAAPGRQPTEAELLDRLPGCVGYLAGVEPVGAALLRQAGASGLRVIGRNGTGTDNLDLAEAAALGIRVVRAEGANARGVAELAWGLVLALARAIPPSDAALKAARWDRRRGIELEGRTLGIVGCGTIGRLVAGFGAAFGMRVVAFDPFPDDTFAASAGVQFLPLETVVESADVLTLHCPPSPDGPVITSERLGAMPAGALLVNTARADLVDGGAVLEALESGRLGGFATDVFPREPPAADDPLPAHPRVVATPHVGGFTGESIDRAVSVAVDRMLAALGATAGS